MNRAIFLLLLAACAEAQPTLPPGDADTCGAGQYANLIGQDATALERVLILGKVRVVRPGQGMTMDFWPDRINFMIDDAGDIAAITCG